VECHKKPEIEVADHKSAVAFDKEATGEDYIARPITVTRSEIEYVYIETSINSTRISIKVKQMDDVDILVAKMSMRLLCQRADMSGF
jgi:actin related protein 2/3 complex subunit 4